MTGLLIFLIMLVALTIVGAYSLYKIEAKEVAWALGMLMIIPITIVIYALCSDCTTNTNEPQAIDVYRGKTTLQITYRDSVPVDSVVVFKVNNYE